MKRETLDKDSFRMFSWVFISSLGSNLPLPVVSSGMTIPWHRAAGQNLSSYIIMLLEQFMTDFVTLTCITSLHWVLLRFSHTYINQSLFMGGHRAVPTPSGCLMTHGLLLWHLQTSKIWYLTHDLLVCVTWAHPWSTYIFLTLPAAFYQKEKTSRLNVCWKVS